MSPLSPSQAILRFGDFHVDLRSCELRKHGKRIKLQVQPFQVLQILLEQAGEVVSREELQKRIWPADTYVDFDQGLNNAVKKLRGALGDDAEKPRFIQTLSKRGYRFIGPVQNRGMNASLGERAFSPTFPETRGPGARRRRLVWGIALGAPVVAVLLMVGFSARGLRDRFFGRGVAPRIQSLAVLPLQNLSNDPRQEFFADGMTDALITDLAQIGTVKVISRTSVMHYKKTDKTLRAIAHELGVDGIIEGTVQRSGDRVRITAQLIEASKDRHLWAKTYEADLQDLLAVESDVARSIANEIEIHLTPAQRARLANATPLNIEAYELYLKGRYFWNQRNPEGLKKALGCFLQAAEKEPGYARAQAGIADAYSLLAAAGYDVLPRAEAMEEARAAASKALQIDDTLAEAHASLGYVLYSYDWNWPQAEKEFKRAIALNPNYPTAHEWYSEYLNDWGRTAQALAEAHAALVLDPFSVVANNYLARAHYFGGRMDQAIETSKEILEMDPNFAVAHLRLGRAYAAKGIYHQAIEEFQEFARLSGDTPLATASVGNALARSGDRSRAMRALKELADLSKQKRVSPICFALVHMGLGDNDQAMAWLERAYKERSDFLLVLKVDPLFDSLRSDPRFSDLLRRIGLPQ